MRVQVRFISVLDMPFKDSEKCKVKSVKLKTFLIFLLLTFNFQLSTFNFVVAIHAEVLDRVVAIVNEEVILFSEFRDTFKKAIEADSKKTDVDVLNEMIDRLLLLEQAKQFGLKNTAHFKTLQDNDAIIEEYINRRIKPFIRITEKEINSYYNEKRELFSGKEFYDIRDEIEAELIEGRLELKLREHTAELRKKSYIRIQLKD